MTLPPNDPYAPPVSATDERASGHAHAPGRIISWLWIGSGGLIIMLELGRVLCDPAGAIGRIAFRVAVLGDDVRIVLLLAWVHAAWRGIPARFRGATTPWRAVLYCCIPGYNLYWGIHMNLALCGILDAILVREGAERKARRTLAVLAYVAWLTSFMLGFVLHRTLLWERIAGLILMVANTVLWSAYVILCDEAREAVVRIADTLNVTGPANPPRVRNPLVMQIAAWGMLWFLLFVGLATWYVLQPGPHRH